MHPTHAMPILRGLTLVSLLSITSRQFLQTQHSSYTLIRTHTPLLLSMPPLPPLVECSNSIKMVNGALWRSSPGNCLPQNGTTARSVASCSPSIPPSSTSGISSRVDRSQCWPTTSRCVTPWPRPLHGTPRARSDTLPLSRSSRLTSSTSLVWTTRLRMLSLAWMLSPCPNKISTSTSSP